MTLPDVCPKDGISQCKKKACHLYVVEWRTGDEQCVIGYSSTHKELSRSTPLEDTYAENTRIRLENRVPREREPWPDTSELPGRGHLKREVSEAEEVRVEVRPEHDLKPMMETSEVYIEACVGKPVPKAPVEPVSHVGQEEVVLNDKNTTVIESKNSDEGKDKEQKKRKSLDEVMDLDLPDDYEEKFWK